MNTFFFGTSFSTTIGRHWRRSVQLLFHYSTSGIKFGSSFRELKLKTVVLFCASVSLWQVVHAQHATWIWYPGDFEINLANKMQNRRTDRNSFFPPFWKMDAHYVLMDFHKTFDLTAPEEIAVYAEGTFNLKLDGNAVESGINKMIVPA